LDLRLACRCRAQPKQQKSRVAISHMANEQPSQTWKSWLALGVAIALTAIVQLTTNASAVGEFSDPYTVIAETGLSPHPQLVSPCAYRFVSPMLAGGVARAYDVSIGDGFFIVSMATSVTLLWLTCYLAMRVGASFAGGLTAMTVIALSIGHLKNNLYFNNSMEGVTQVLMIGWCLAMFARRWITATILCVVGLCTRELFLIPSALLCGQLAFSWWQTRSCATGSASASTLDMTFSAVKASRIPSIWRNPSLYRLAAAAILTAAAFILPRLLIPVAATIQLIDPLYDASWFSKLLQVPLNWKRDLNLMIGILSYSLPVLMLMTRERWRLIWQRLKPFQSAGVAYCGLWLLLTLWGGTDLYRYVTYLFLPLTFVLAAMFADHRSSPRFAEIILALVATAIHNKIFSHIPAIADNVDVYLDFWPAFEDRLNAAAAVRFAQIAGFLLAAFGLRWTWSRWSQANDTAPGDQSHPPLRRAA
jgi:hypothetical protein